MGRVAAGSLLSAEGPPSPGRPYRPELWRGESDELIIYPFSYLGRECVWPTFSVNGTEVVFHAFQVANDRVSLSEASEW